MQVEVKQVGSRGVLFSFDELGGVVNVYLINGHKHIYIIDTYIGPDAMEQVNSYIGKNFGEKPVVVVNTHHHWDHVWGNCAYISFPIVAHKRCLELLCEKGDEDFAKYGEHAKGKVEIILPSITFTTELEFEDDKVLLFHSPGHTEDCITIFDKLDKVLIVGDNLERPIPYLMAKSLETYMKTLNSYLEMDFNAVIGGHIGIEGKELIHKNAEYIRRFAEGCAPELEDGEYKYIHELNKKRRTDF